MSCPNGREKWADAIGAMKSLPANADAPGAPMRVAELGNANIFGDLLDRPQSVARNIAAQNLDAPLNAETAK